MRCKTNSLLFPCLLAATTANASASYSLVDTYDKTNFFSSFDFFSEADPTHGFVSYKSAADASSSGLAGYFNNMVYLGVDHKNSASSSGRASTRVTSQKSYTHGLFVADIAHMPFGCGVWPALWTLGPNWPNGGEIDIIEGVNSQTANIVTLHTSENCSMGDSGSDSSTAFLNGATSVDCGASGGGTGCPLYTTNTKSYGQGFNDIGGGVYVMEWTSDHISVWFFARGTAGAEALGSGASGDSVDSSVLGTPLARFSGCDIDDHFHDHQIILNTALCGDWAGNTWSSDATCASKADSCTAYVQQNADDFVDAYWLINSIKVYQSGSSSRRRSSTTGLQPVPFMA